MKRLALARVLGEAEENTALKQFSESYSAMLVFHIALKNLGCVLCWKHCHSFVDILHWIIDATSEIYTLNLSLHLN